MTTYADCENFFSTIYDAFDGMVVPVGIGSCEGAQAMRGRGAVGFPRYTSVEIARTSVRLDIRFLLWKKGRVVLRQIDDAVLADSEPLRFWWPGKFVEPTARRAIATGYEYSRSKWWLYAPFEVRLLNDHERHGQYEFGFEANEVANIDDMNRHTDHRWWTWQLTRRYTHFSPAKFLLVFRFLCRNHP